MTLDDVQSFPDLEKYLREFTQFEGEWPYDFVGVFTLFRALMDNLMRFAEEDDLRVVKDYLEDRQSALL